MKEFLEEIEKYYEELSPQSQDFYNQLKKKIKEELTEKGEKILSCMLNNQIKYSNNFSARQLGEILFMSPRSVSGAIRKLISCDYVTKQESNPITYSITEKGKDIIDKK